MKALFVTLLALVTCMVFAPVSALGDTWGEPINNPTRFAVLSSYNNQAVLDKETGLVWEQAVNTTPADWHSVQNVCNLLGVGNRKGWRLPTLQELASLVDPTVPPPGPALPAGHPFSNVQSSGYWSVTTYSNDTTWAWFVTFLPGTSNVGFDPKALNHLVWCVRGGQGVDPQ